MSVRRLLGLALALGALAVPSVAHAADTTITFNGLAAGTDIRDQYADQGVLFGPASAFTFPPAYTDCSPGKALAFENQLQLGRCGGTNEFPFYATMGAFGSPRGKISMRLSAPGTGDSADETTTLRVFNYSKNLVASATVPDTVAGRTLSITRGTPDIYYFTIVRDGISSNPPTVDDFTFDNPPVPPDPHIGFGIEDLPSSHLRQGGSIDITLRILRLGGSTGAVDLNVTGLPADVKGTISPDPATGSAFLTKATLHLTADSNAVLRHLEPKVTATPSPSAGDVGAEASFAVDVVRPFALTLQDTQPAVAPCSPSSIPMRLDVETGFADPINLTVTRSNDAVKADLPATFTPGFGTPPTSIPVSADTTASTSTTLTVTARSGSFSSTGTVTVGRSTGEVTSVLLMPGGGRVTNALAPSMGRPGSFLRLNGRGLCPNQTVKFGGGDPTGAPLENVAPDGSHGFVHVPITATSGPVKVSGPDGSLTSTSPLGIITFANTFGFPFANFNSAGPAWEDIVKLYGTDKTNVRVNVCEDITFGLVSCGVTSFVPRAEVLIYFGTQKDLGEKGNCYGLNLAAYRLWSRGRALSDFAPAGAENPFGLDGAAGPAGPLRAYVRLMMLAQNSSEVLRLRTIVGKQNAGSMYQAIAAGLAQNHPVMLSLKGEDSGHSVVAYGLTPTATGYDVEVYNPNDPHTADDDARPSTHALNLENSRVHVDTAKNTWSFTELGYGGGFDKIGAYDISKTPQSLSPPVGLDDLLVSMGVDAAPTGPDGKPIDDAVRLPAETGGKGGPSTDLIPRGEALATSLAGAGETVALLGKDHSFQVAGGGKTLTLDAAGEIVGVRGASKNLRLTATSASGATTRTAAATFPGGGDDAIGFGTASALTVKAGAAGGAVSLTLGQVGPRGAGSMTVAGLRLRGGETATVRPASWSTPGAVKVSIRGKGGKTRKLTLRGHAAKALSKVTALKAKAGKGGQVTVTAKAKLPAGGVPATGTLVWQARKGKSTRAVRKGSVAIGADDLAAVANGKALSFRVGAPKGTYKVKVALVIGSTAKGGVVPALAKRTTNVTVKLT
ncbi:hypothetical protein [Baekduia sp. Peel2402]|uniref:hypothetical protein n=1 Tax=Baekduia sp. Peel2402 TaxID=3458296 RepID=UPI00403ECB86